MSQGVTTREFVIGDYDAVIALWNGVNGIEISEGDSREEIAHYFERNPGLSHVAEADGRIVGAALCGHDGRRGWIYHLAVTPSHRRQQVGKLVGDACVNALRAVGLKRAIILVAGDNPSGHEFWLRNGWENIDGAIAMTREL
jgi:ribosomal protein S18 acetylase RimI-like enzyme